MTLLDKWKRKPDEGVAGVAVQIKHYHRQDAQRRTPRTGKAQELAVGVLLATVFYLLAHYSIVTGVWPVHGTADGSGDLLIRDGIALVAWLALFPLLTLLGYRGSWAIVALPVMIFLLARPSIFQLFSDPVYQASAGTRVEANALKAQRSRLTTILRTYPEERQEQVFGDAIPAIPDPMDAVREAATSEGSFLGNLGSAGSVIVAPLAILLAFLAFRRQGSFRWLRDHREIPFGAVLGLFFILTLFFVRLGRVGGTTPWELFLPIFILVWAAVLADDVYNLARPGAAVAPRRVLGLLLYGALPLVPFLVIRELGLSVVLAGSLATMLLVSTRREWWAGLMLVVWVILVAAAFNLDTRSATRLQLAINPYRDSSAMSTEEAESWAARMHQFKLFDANVLAGGLIGEGAGRGHPETAPNAADDGYITSIAANWGLIGGVGLVLLYTAFIIELLNVAVREKSAFERSLVSGMAMLLAIPFWMAALGGMRAVPLTGVATAFAAHGGAKLVASSLVIGIIAAVSHRRAEHDRLAAAGESSHATPEDQGVRIR